MVSSSLPAVIDPLGSTPPPGQWTEFDRPRQVAFLTALAECGNVRAAAASCGVSYRTAYRARRREPAFRQAWTGALVAARPVSEDVLTTRAIDGVEEIVWFRGEEVGRRVRYDSRLLLAHLARLDKLCEDAAACAIAEDFEGALERFVAGEELVAPSAESCSPGHRDRCDKSNSADGAPEPGPGRATPAGPALAEDGRPLKWCPHARKMLHPDAVRRNEMVAQRPDGARPTWQFPGFEAWEVEAEQLEAFEAGVDHWWLIVPPGPNDDPTEWVWFDEAA